MAIAKKNPTPVETMFKKHQLLRFGRYENRADLLAVLLDDKKSYSFTEVDALLDKFMERKVKRA